MNVAIAGYGQEGEASYRYWHNLGAKLTILDENKPTGPLPKGALTKFGATAFEDLADYDLVVRTASLRPDKLRSAKKVWSATNEFFAQCPAPIIGVTGTKGKGTTCSLIAEILKAAGKTVHLVGNIGVPALEVLPQIKSDDLVVFELSSFQLWDLEKSPQTAVVLMIEPDHMDIHASMEEYINAKANISRHQQLTDLIIYHPKNQFSQKIANQSPARKQQYMTKSGAYTLYALQSQTQPKEYSWIPVEFQGDPDEWLAIDQQLICKVNDVALLGRHNLENVCAAITAVWEYIQNVNAVKKAISGFKGLPHRLELVAEVDGVKYYDDSFSTGVGATIAAVKAFDEPVTLILGGSDKGVSIAQLFKWLDPTRHRLLLIGAVAQQLEAQCLVGGFKNYTNLGSSVTMSQIVEMAKELTPKGGVVLLSPAHASFGMFKSYYDRGDQFKAAVAQLQ